MKNFKDLIPGSKLCDICGKPLTNEQILRRSTARVCSTECWAKYLSIRPQKYGYNTTFLDEDNEFSFYFIGYWIADGNLSIVDKITSIASGDYDIIQQFMLRTDYVNSIGGSKREEKNKPEYSVKYAGPISKHIMELGYQPGSKFRLEFTPQRIWNRPDLIHHYYRACIDADGSVHYRPQYGLRISLNDSSEDFLIDLHDYLLENKIVQGGYVGPKGNIFVMSFCHLDSLHLCQWMYKDATIMLHRKYDNYLLGKDFDLQAFMQKGLTCFVEGCVEPSHCNGMCKKHYDACYSKLYRETHKEHLYEKDKKYREENRDKINVKRRRLHAENPELYNGHSRNWKRNNPEKVREQKRIYNATHRDEINQYKREVRVQNIDKTREQEHASYLRNRESKLAGKERYRQEHREELNEKQREYAARNKEKVAQAQKEYKEKNRELLKQKAKERYYKNREQILQKEKEKCQREKEQTNQIAVVTEPMPPPTSDVPPTPDTPHTQSS